MFKHFLSGMICCLALVVLAFIPVGGVLAQSSILSSTFTYQGYLTNAGGPINGLCDIQFGLFDALSAGSQMGSTLTKTNVSLNNGTFTVQLDFGGAAFDGNDRYLQIAVRCPAGIGSYMTLAPRQPVTPAPYSLFAEHVPWSGLTGLNCSAGQIPKWNGAAWVCGGGSENSASGFLSTIGGGGENTASGSYSTVAGGRGNQAIGWWSMVGGGQESMAYGSYSTVGGGVFNAALGHTSTVAGGDSNSAGGTLATIGGGNNNIASGNFSVVPGGSNNTASGNYSLAAGRYAEAASDGAFVWADSTIVTTLSSSAANQFLVRASGGIWLYTNAAQTSGVVLNPGSSAWSVLSDRNMKSNLTPVDTQAILQRVAHLPLSTWNYNTQDASIRHIGPMAQDFYATFGLGEDERHISTVDADGVALAAIQGLYEMVQDKDVQIAALKTRLDSLETRLSALEHSSGGTPVSSGNTHDVVLLVGLVVVGAWSLRRHS